MSALCLLLYPIPDREYSCIETANPPKIITDR